MNNVVYNGKYWFYLDEDKDVIVIPIPGDIIIEEDGFMRLVANTLFLQEGSKLNLDILVFSKKDWALGRRGAKRWIMEVENIDFSKEKLKSYTILRGCTKIYPISLKFKVFNFCAIIKNNIKSFFKKN